MTVATAFAVSWKPFTNSKPSAMKSATPRRMNGNIDDVRTWAMSLTSCEPAYAKPHPIAAVKTSAPSLPGLRVSFASSRVFGVSRDAAAVVMARPRSLPRQGEDGLPRLRARAGDKVVPSWARAGDRARHGSGVKYVALAWAVLALQSSSPST